MTHSYPAGITVPRRSTHRTLDSLRDCATISSREHGRRHSRKLIPAIFTMADDGERPRYHFSRLAAGRTSVGAQRFRRSTCRGVARALAHVWRVTSTGVRRVSLARYRYPRSLVKKNLG